LLQRRPGIARRAQNLPVIAISALQKGGDQLQRSSRQVRSATNQLHRAIPQLQNGSRLLQRSFAYKTWKKFLLRPGFELMR